MSVITKESLKPAIDVLTKHAATYQRIGFERAATLDELNIYRDVVHSLRTAIGVLRDQMSEAPSEVDLKKK